MTIIAAIPVLVFVAGLILYFYGTKLSKREAASEIGKWMFVVGLLVWLMGAGAQSCSGGVAGGGGGSSQHR